MLYRQLQIGLALIGHRDISLEEKVVDGENKLFNNHRVFESHAGHQIKAYREKGHNKKLGVPIGDRSSERCSQQRV
jgi:hypothetical protein